MEVDQFGDPVLADVIACVRQQGEGLSFRTHLGEEGHRGGWASFSRHATNKDLFLGWSDMRTHLAREDIQAISQDLGVLLQLLDLVGYAVVCRMGQGVSRVGEDHQGVHPGLEQRASQRQQV